MAAEVCANAGATKRVRASADLAARAEHRQHDLKPHAGRWPKVARDRWPGGFRGGFELGSPEHEGHEEAS